MENLLELSKKTLKRRVEARIKEVQEKISATKIQKVDESSPSEEDTDSELESLSSETPDEGSSTHDTSYESEYNDDTTDALRDLIVEFNIAAPCVNRLLIILKSAGLQFLPKTYVALMKTDDVKPKIQEFFDGRYVHFGLAKQISDKLDLLPIATNEDIKININIDGTPLTKSSGSQFWPILGSIQIPSIQEPFEIGIFASPNVKPKTTDFMNQFVQEAKELQKSGLFYKNKIHQIILNAFVCETPQTVSF
jgi:hypothetical protein